MGTSLEHTPLNGLVLGGNLNEMNDVVVVVAVVKQQEK